MYGDLVYASPGLRRADIPKYFKDATFGVKQDGAERIYSPPGRDDVTIVRDTGFGVPHIYGKTRAGTMFGLGYVGAEDRLFTMDALRNAGRAQLSAFAGGGAGNRAHGPHAVGARAVPRGGLPAPVRPRGRGLRGRPAWRSSEDVTNYVAGINRYITEARVNPLKMPGEYAAIGKPAGPQDWKVTDVIATASLIGGIFGKGGGRELDSALLLPGRRAALRPQARQAGLGGLPHGRGPGGARDGGRAERFPYRAEPRKLRRGGAALPDRGTVKRLEVSDVDAAAARASRAARRARASAACSAGFPRAGSNALLVSGRESESGNPLAVFGPQTGLLRAAAPDGRGRARARASTRAAPPSPASACTCCSGAGATTPGAPPRPARTSSTRSPCRSASRTARRPRSTRCTTASAASACRSTCSRRRTAGRPSPADDTPPGSETLHAERTKLGLVTARATVRGKPVAYTRLRSTYFHEADSALGFVDAERPVEDPRPARTSSGPPRRSASPSTGSTRTTRTSRTSTRGTTRCGAKRTSTHFPVSSAFAWRNWNTDLWTARYTPLAHPPAGDRPALLRELEQQAGARLPGGRRQLRLRLDLPLAVARRPDPARDPRRRRRCRSPS